MTVTSESEGAVVPFSESAVLDELEVLLEHRFARRAWLEKALTHASYAHEVGAQRSNERLEFLGDAVLDLVLAELLFEVRPEWQEGDLTLARHSLVNTGALAERARQLDLGRFARLGRTERRSGGHEKESILANLFEAVCGALYLDGGLQPVRALVRRLFAPELLSGERPFQRDPKTRFQHWAHAELHATPRYRLRGDSGMEEDAERFTVEVEVAGQIYGCGTGRTKRAAERAAAAAALTCIETSST